MPSHCILLVDEGCWRDPTVFGPFPSADDARDHIRLTWPSMAADPDDADCFVDEGEEALVIPLDEPPKTEPWTIRACPRCGGRDLTRFASTDPSARTPRAACNSCGWERS